MGLKKWKQAPAGKILKADVSIAKNYLNEEHLKELERIVSAYLDLAENRAARGIVINTKDWYLCPLCLMKMQIQMHDRQSGFYIVLRRVMIRNQENMPH